MLSPEDKEREKPLQKPPGGKKENLRKLKSTARPGGVKHRSEQVLRD